MPLSPTARRCAGPIALSLLGHAALVLVLVLLPGSLQEQRVALGTTVADAPLSLRLAGAVPSRGGRPTAPARPRPDDDDGFEVKVAILAPPAPVAQPVATAMPGPALAPVPLSSGARQGTGASGAGGGGLADPGALAAPLTARSVVFVVDRSLSMGPSGAWAAARATLLASLRRLPPGTRFQVIAYNRAAEPLCVDGQRGLLPADAATVEKAARLLAEVSPSGGTNHGAALRRGLLLRPDVLFFVTDADELSLAEVGAVAGLNQGRAVIQVVEVNRARAEHGAGLLRRLAAENRGAYRRVAPGG